VDDVTLPLGAFHEVSLSTRDLAASVAFWEAHGWVTGAVRPVWPHPYAVLSNGGIVIGLHEYRFPSPSVTCVHPGIATALESHRDAGMVIAFAQTGPDRFNEFGFRDPHDHMVTLLEAPTHEVAMHPAPPQGVRTTPSAEVFFSLPAEDIDLGLRFWGLLGATEQGHVPGGWPCRRFSAGGLPMALHAAAHLDRPALVRIAAGGSATGPAVTSPEGLAWVLAAA
jgi:catechol 2,3-dioxygenase-like lactoylglutathione lyase family enzyme